MAARGNTLSGDEAFGNTLAGVYLGCSAKGVINPVIPCTITTTTGNTVAYNDSEGGYYGIAVERKSIYNQIESNLAEGNSKDDMADGNGNCIYNTYLSDLFVTKNLPCIQ